MQTSSDSSINEVSNVAPEKISPSVSESSSYTQTSTSSSSGSSAISSDATVETSVSEASSHAQVQPKAIKFSSATAKDLDHLGVTVRHLVQVPLPFTPTDDVDEAVADLMASVRKVQNILIDDIRGNHSLVTHMFLRSAIKLSARQHPSFHFSVCTNKKYNERNEVGPIKNEKSGNALIFRGTLPHLITRFETSEAMPHAVDSTGFFTRHQHSFVLISMRGYLNERLPEAITHALALSHVSGQEKIRFCVTDGQEWIFATLQRNPSSGGWVTLVSHHHDIEFQDTDPTDSSELPEGIPRAPLIMEFLLKWIGEISDENIETEAETDFGLDPISFSPMFKDTSVLIPPQAIPFSSVTLAHIADLGVKIKPFHCFPEPTVHTISAEETQVIEEVLEQLREEYTFCYDEETGNPPTTLSVLMIGVAKILAIRVPSHRLRVLANMIYDGFYDGFGVDNSVIPLKNTTTGDEILLQGLANNVVIDHENKPHNSLDGPPALRGQFMPIFYPSFVFQASQGSSTDLSASFPEAIAQGMAICRCSERDQIYFCVTDGHHWVFFLLRQDVNDKDKWTAFYSEEHDTTWIAGTDGGKPNPHLTFVLRLLLEWVSGTNKNKCFESV